MNEKLDSPLQLDPWPYASIGGSRHTTGKGGGVFDPRGGYSQNRADYTPENPKGVA